MPLIHRLLLALRGQTVRKFTGLEGRLGYRFKNTILLEQALTHRSVADSSYRNFERLEFLGDAILSHVISTHLYARYRDDSEGELTLKRSSLVSKKYLAGIGEELGLHEFLQVNSGVRLNDDKVRRNLVGDAMEALIGAMYLDGGMQKAEQFVKWKVLKRAKEAAQLINHKGHLIEFCHQYDLGNPRFQLLSTQGPEHDKKFVVQVRIGPRTFENAQANNKKAAEQKAAEQALETLRSERD